ncbi:tripartite tricarboxylate transporter substrate-binding protein [Burkholderia sp. LFS038]|uniref:tripartite tricarboxylate transporter substrate-binding protein n=1 Tax=Burkholderia sp. LFS038 TaxID=3229884 RepID=UPI003A810542
MGPLMRKVRLAGAATVMVALVAGCSVGPGSHGGGSGAKYPDGPVEIVVTYSAGGASDQLARTLSPSLESSLGTSVIIQNQAGGSGTVALASLVKAAPDGYSPGLHSRRAGHGAAALRPHHLQVR